jgi:uncharacterized protein Yka (UPF0111/DUF47 family)
MAEYIYESMSDEIQKEIYDKILNKIYKLSRRKRPMVDLMEMIDELTHDTIIETAQDCQFCECPAENMEYQDFDKIFICPDCGEPQ